MDLYNANVKIKKQTIKQIKIMRKSDIINIIKEVVAKRPYYTDKPNVVIIENIYCGDDLILGLEFNGDDDILLYDNYDINGRSVQDYTMKQTIRFTGRLIALYENCEALGADDEHYERLVELWVEKHNKQEVFLVTTALTDSDGPIELSNSVFCDEDDAYNHLYSLIKGWKEKHKPRLYDISSEFCGHKDNNKVDSFTDSFINDYGVRKRVYITLDKAKVE